MTFLSNMAYSTKEHPWGFDLVDFMWNGHILGLGCMAIPVQQTLPLVVVVWQENPAGQLLNPPRTHCCVWPVEEMKATFPPGHPNTRKRTHMYLICLSETYEKKMNTMFSASGWGCSTNYAVDLGGRSLRNRNMDSHKHLSESNFVR